MNTDVGPLISLLLTAASLILGYLAKNSGLAARGIGTQVEKAQQTVTGTIGNGIGGVTAVIESQTLADKLIIQRMDMFERETIRRLDDILLRQGEYGRRYDERFAQIDARLVQGEQSQAALARRVYNLEHPPTPTESPVA